jgi:predicted N-acetyltransferase YhbS
MRIERLSSKDFEEAMDFANMVFSMTYGPMDFVRFLPRLYKPTDECMGRNLVVRENGKIRALVGMYPDQVMIGDVRLRLGGIGAVSSHPGDRGKGWMKLLMERQIEAMVQEGTDLSFLVGQRQRYGYFGYEKAGSILECKVTANNLRHFNESRNVEPISFEPLRRDDAAHLSRAKALHDTQPVRCLRSLEEFHLYLLTSYMQPWIALNREGEMVGYLTANSGHDKITELFAEDGDSLAGMLSEWLTRHMAPEVTISIPTWNREAARLIGSLAEDIRLTNTGNWRIFDWRKVAGALLSVKCAQGGLAEGELVVGIEGHASLRISVRGDKAACEATTEHPDVSWDPFVATRVLFGNIPSACVGEMPRRVEPLIASWFPLPLGWLPQNSV